MEKLSVRIQIAVVEKGVLETKLHYKSLVLEAHIGNNLIPKWACEKKLLQVINQLELLYIHY